MVMVMAIPKRWGSMTNSGLMSWIQTATQMRLGLKNLIQTVILKLIPKLIPTVIQKPIPKRSDLKNWIQTTNRMAIQMHLD